MDPSLDALARHQGRYLHQYAFSPLWVNTRTEYLPTGEVKFRRLLEELEKAENYIFMEYYIIEPGEMWNTVLEVLERKAASGVDVRVIYDDYGCMKTLPAKYSRKLGKRGIKCAVFNPIRPVLSAYINSRDHRKITVIDGRAAFTGGINIADEYINRVDKYGHWKDVAIFWKVMPPGVLRSCSWEWGISQGRKRGFFTVPSAPASRDTGRIRLRSALC